MKVRFFNTVLPMKVYGIWDGDRRLGEVTADDVQDAFRQGRLLYGADCRTAILEGNTNREPMFLRNN